MIVKALGVLCVIGIGSGDAGEQILIGFAGKQIAIIKRVAAEIGEQRVARAINGDREFPRHDLVGGALGGGRLCVGRLGGGRHCRDVRLIERQHVAALGAAFRAPKFTHLHAPNISWPNISCPDICA